MKSFVTTVLLCAGIAQAQDGAGWRRFSEGVQQQQSPAAPPAPAQAAPNYPQQPPPTYSQPQSPQAYSQPPMMAQPPVQVPQHLTIAPGTWITVRVTNPLSSDHNLPGDAFSAVLVQPVIVNGLVVARRGQSIGGRVAVAEKAGRVKGVSKLGVELTELTLVDGQQVPLRTQMMQRAGNTSWGRDAVGIGTTVGTGAAIGAAVNGGVGAGVGAAAGVVASTLGVLMTRGEPSIIYPETVLTFRVEAPVTISTERSYDAFRAVDQQDYERSTQHMVTSTPPRPAPYYGVGPGYYPYRPYYYPGYFGPSFFFSYGYRGGHYRRW